MAGLARSASGLWVMYESLLQKHPVRTQMATSAVLWHSVELHVSDVVWRLCRALGDVFSQKLEGQKQLNAKRTAYTATFGGALLGPVGHLWYGSLDTIAAKLVRKGTGHFILTKVAADELLFGPLHVLGFFTFMTKAEGGSWQDVQQKIRRDFWSTYLAELAVWPAFQAFNFWKVCMKSIQGMRSKKHRRGHSAGMRNESGSQGSAETELPLSAVERRSGGSVRSQENGQRMHHQGAMAGRKGLLSRVGTLCRVKNQDDWLAAMGLRKAPTAAVEQLPVTPER